MAREILLRLGVLVVMLGGGQLHAQSADPDSVPKIAAPKPEAHGKAKAAKPASTVAKAATAATTVAPPPKVPVAPPPAPVLPPPIVVPLRPMPPPPPAAVVANAAGEATRTKDGLRVTFGPGSSDLNQATDSALRALVHDAPHFATTTFTVLAVAPGVAEDPSTPRRLSLSRALAVRSVLITEGVASNRIYVRAMGASPLAIVGGPADRADVVLGGTTPAAQEGAQAGSTIPGNAPEKMP